MKKLSNIVESFWGDVHRRSRGDEVRIEDEVPQELQKPLAAYIDMFTSHAACRGDYTLGSYPDFRAFVKDFMDNRRILQLHFDMQFLLDYIKDHWNDILPIILDTYNKIEDDINVAVDDIVNHLKKQDLKESFWGDVHKRSRGDEVRKEDEIGNLRSLKPVDMGGSVLWADQNLIYDGDEIFTFEDANNLISDSGWRLPTRKEVAELDSYNKYYDSTYVYLGNDKKLSFKKCGCGYTPKTGKPFTLDENKAFYGWTSEPYQYSSNDIHVFILDHFELAYSPEKETINNQVTQNADSKCCVRLVKDK